MVCSLVSKQKDLATLKSELALRASEYDAAFYLDEGSKLADMEASLKSAFSQESLVLEELFPRKGARLDIVANGKVSQAKHKQTWQGIDFLYPRRWAFYATLRPLLYAQRRKVDRNSINTAGSDQKVIKG